MAHTLRSLVVGIAIVISLFAIGAGILKNLARPDQDGTSNGIRRD